LTRAERVKSDLYRELLSAINSQSLELLDHPKLISQLCARKRRTSRGGRDSIDHPPGAHDDVENSVAGVVDLLIRCRRETMADLYGPEASGPTIGFAIENM